MEGHLWLLLQVLPLLAAAAAVFFGLGWFWRGCLPPSTPTPPASPAENAEIQKKLIQAEAALLEAQGSQNLLQKEMLRLADTLKEAQAQTQTAESAERAAQARLASEREIFEQEKAAWVREQQPTNEPSKSASAAPKSKAAKGQKPKD